MVTQTKTMVEGIPMRMKRAFQSWLYIWLKCRRVRESNSTRNILSIGVFTSVHCKNMADSKEIVSDSVSSWTPEFITELLPAAERTALLYNLSYLCLGGFPKLECLIRERALETQLLFKSSVVILQECAITSSTLVFSLFPLLLTAVEHNDPSLAVKYLVEIRAKINDIIKAVKDIVKRYDDHNRSIASRTSDVLQEKMVKEKQLTQTTVEIKSLEEAVAKLEEELRQRAEQIDKKQKTIEEKNSELHNLITAFSAQNIGFGILALFFPFIGVLAKVIHDTTKSRALRAEVSRLTSEKRSMQQQESSTQVKLADLQMQLAKCKIQLGVIPSPVHLAEVQKCLSQIQQILVRLQKFWEKVGSLIDTLKDNTFVNQYLIEHLSDMKQEFVTSIVEAEMCWQRFGGCCRRAQVIFSVQSKDAYKFLKMNPSSLSKAEWDEQHKSIIEKLNQISPQEMPMI